MASCCRLSADLDGVRAHPHTGPPRRRQHRHKSKAHRVNLLIGFAVVKGEPGLESVAISDRLRAWDPENDLWVGCSELEKKGPEHVPTSIGDRVPAYARRG